MTAEQIQLNPGSDRFVLSINGGSSSLKCSLFKVGPPLTCIASCKADRIGFPEGTLTLTDVAGGTGERKPIQAAHQKDCIEPLLLWLEQQVRMTDLMAIGHRVVQGGHRYSEPQRITSEVMDELRRLSPYDPEHLPAEIELIETVGRRYPKLQQVACFDTSFHRDMPRVARLLPIPRRYDKAGVQRYGFHGLSYSYLMQELKHIAPHEAQGRIILAHLGSGASMAAVLRGQGIDTSMGFTPVAGLPMSTRSGDLDPGLVSYLSKTEGMTVEQFHRMVNQQSGLLGVSETSSDLRDLLASEGRDPRAAEAVALFCYQAKKWIGSFAAAWRDWTRSSSAAVSVKTRRSSARASVMAWNSSASNWMGLAIKMALRSFRPRAAGLSCASFTPMKRVRLHVPSFSCWMKNAQNNVKSGW
jgi:acetate kinase